MSRVSEQERLGPAGSGPTAHLAKVKRAHFPAIRQTHPHPADAATGKEGGSRSVATFSRKVSFADLAVISGSCSDDLVRRKPPAVTRECSFLTFAQVGKPPDEPRGGTTEPWPGRSATLRVPRPRTVSSWNTDRDFKSGVLRPLANLTSAVRPVPHSATSVVAAPLFP
jgi:hypothetical protein